MRLCVIEVGRPPAPLDQSFPDYPDAFRELLASGSSDLEFSRAAVAYGQPLPALDEADGFLITGSAAGIYDDHDWIAPLEDFVRDARAAKKKQIGICFGHQVLASAFGGEVVQSERGWGLGTHVTEVVETAGWMSPPVESLALHVTHRDQVFEHWTFFLGHDAEGSRKGGQAYGKFDNSLGHGYLRKIQECDKFLPVRPDSRLLEVCTG